MVIFSLFLLLMAAWPAAAHNGAGAIAVPLQGIVIDGELSDWPEAMRRYPIQRRTSGHPLSGAADFNGNFRVGYNAAEGTLLIGLEIEDDSMVEEALGENPWNAQDGCEIYLALDHEEDSIPIQFYMWGDEVGKGEQKINHL